MALIYDVETNGLLDTLDRVHCLSIRDTESGQHFQFRKNETEDTIEIGLRMLMAADLSAGHNVIKFDIPAIQKVYPWFRLERHQVFDTIVATRLIWADLTKYDLTLIRKKRLPGNMLKRHSLEAWGYRVGEWKGDYDGDTRIADEKYRKATKWDHWNPDMDAYCGQDTLATLKLFELIVSKAYAVESLALEHRAAWALAGAERYGWSFDEQGAVALYTKLVEEKLRIETELRAEVRPLCVRGKVFVPRRDNRTMGYAAGCAMSKVSYESFNPGSRAQIGRVLMERYGWEPIEWTDGGQPVIDDEVLIGLTAPIALKLKRYLMLEKRLGQIAEGKGAWLKVVRNGRIHHECVTNGTVTGRPSHANPNVAQVPKVGKEFGEECRALFRATPGIGRVQVGADLAGIELRCLGHYMAPFDGGAYARAVVEGTQEEGTDVHTLNCLAIGLEPKRIYTLSGKTSKGRDFAKTFAYAFLYGAGDEKLGLIVGGGRTRGRKLREDFLNGLPAMGRLIDKVKRLAKRDGVLPGLDGRLLHVRSEHAALNTLLQSAGALIAKLWLVLVEDEIDRRGWRGRVQLLAWIHDELQYECDPEIAEEFGRAVCACAKQAGEEFGFRVPVDAEFKIGNNWKDCH